MCFTFAFFFFLNTVLWMMRVGRIVNGKLQYTASIKARLLKYSGDKKKHRKLGKRTGRANETFAPLDRSLTFYYSSDIIWPQFYFTFFFCPTTKFIYSTSGIFHQGGWKIQLSYKRATFTIDFFLLRKNAHLFKKFQKPASIIIKYNFVFIFM